MPQLKTVGLQNHSSRIPWIYQAEILCFESAEKVTHIAKQKVKTEHPRCIRGF